MNPLRLTFVFALLALAVNSAPLEGRDETAAPPSAEGKHAYVFPHEHEPEIDLFLVSLGSSQAGHHPHRYLTTPHSPENRHAFSPSFWTAFSVLGSRYPCLFTSLVDSRACQHSSICFRRDKEHLCVPHPNPKRRPCH
ncbi:hypothetical protein C8R43DRAFT_974357 [Mycena crocata]|nr:hypothetical protein C8R43DRAFT_974357 [Mycena crocata]